MFENKEEKNPIFRSGLYFFLPRGIYLNRWSLNFDHEINVTSVVYILGMITSPSTTLLRRQIFGYDWKHLGEIYL
jgi:hypothetical protein